MTQLGCKNRRGLGFVQRGLGESTEPQNFVDPLFSIPPPVPQTWVGSWIQEVGRGPGHAISHQPSK